MQAILSLTSERKLTIKEYRPSRYGFRTVEISGGACCRNEFLAAELFLRKSRQVLQVMKKSVGLIVFFWLLLAAAAGVRAEAVLFGTLGVTGDDGRFVPGSMIRVYLVREKIPCPRLSSRAPAGLARLEWIEKVNDAHLAFFKAFRQKAARKGFIVAETVTSRSGTFTFRGLAPGTYYVVVTFPAMIRCKKVTWQVPVKIPAGGYSFVHLDSSNLALPVGQR